MTDVYLAKRRNRTRPRRLTSLRLLVATAGESDSLGALNVAAQLERRRQAAVLAVGVTTPFPHTVSSFVSIRPAVVADETNRLEVLEQLRDQLAKVKGTGRWLKRAVVGFPGDALNSMADAWKASLIVLGLVRHSRLERVFGPGTTADVIKRAHVPVLAVPPDVVDLPKRACAAIDFSPASMASALTAAKLLAADGTLTLVHVCAFSGAKAAEGDFVDVYRAGARAKLDGAVADVQSHTRRNVEGVMLDGEPSATLLGYVRQNSCDLIALGGHELGLVDRVLLGSVRSRVLHNAPCSVLISPPRR
jgi:nucleotide-binding universal stress UspA family protein